jgi:hypothetical protein
MREAWKADMAVLADRGRRGDMIVGILSILKICVADPGCFSRIPEPKFFHPGSASKNLCILTQKMVFKLSEI